LAREIPATRLSCTPSLDLVITGAVYGICFHMFEETNTAQLQNMWIKSIEEVEELNSKIVAPSHIQSGD
jgi:hypothetical protein